MEFVEGFLGDWPSHDFTRGQGCFIRPVIHPGLRNNLINVAGHQLDASIVEIFAGLVVDGDPAHQIDDVAFGRRHNVVIRVPVQPAGNVTQLAAAGARLVGL